MPDQFEPVQPFWEKTPAEQAHIWQNRFTIALVVAVVGWLLVLVCFFSAIAGKPDWTNPKAVSDYGHPAKAIAERLDRDYGLADYKIEITYTNFKGDKTVIYQRYPQGRY